MIKSWLIIIFIVSYFFDAIFLPAFLGFENSFLTILFLISVISYFGVDNSIIIHGSVLYFCLELLSGYYFGLLMLPFLIICLLIYLFRQYLNIGLPADGDGFANLLRAFILGLFCTGVYFFISNLINFFVYNASFHFRYSLMPIYDTGSVIFIVSALLFYLALIKLISRNRVQKRI